MELIMGGLRGLLGVKSSIFKAALSPRSRKQELQIKSIVYSFIRMVKIAFTLFAPSFKDYAQNIQIVLLFPFYIAFHYL